MGDYGICRIDSDSDWAGGGGSPATSLDHNIWNALRHDCMSHLRSVCKRLYHQSDIAFLFLLQSSAYFSTSFSHLSTQSQATEVIRVFVFP